MNRRFNRPVALGAAGLLAIAGGGVAYAATSGTSPRDALLNDAAKRLDVSPDKLRSALQGAAGDQLDQAVRAGKLTQQQADRIKQRMQQDGGLPPLGGPRGFHRGFGAGFGGPGPFMIGLDAAARYLGLTPAQLAGRLHAGKSLADVAKAQGKSVTGLEDALVATAKDRLEKAVAAGRITAAQRDRILNDLKAHVADLVTRTPPAGGPGGRPCPPGMGMHRWGGGNGSSTTPGSYATPAVGAPGSV